MHTYRKLILSSLCAVLCLCPFASAQISFDFEDIDTIMQDNEFNDIANRYGSILLSFFPERASRLGFTSANTQLDDRTPQNSAQALSALQGLRRQLEAIDSKSLSVAKQADLQLVFNDVDYMLWLERQDRVRTSPLYYAEALDAVYELRTKKISSPIRQRMDILARLKALSKVADQAEKNLTNAPAFQAQLAMEKAYYAFLSADELTEFLLQTSTDQDTSEEIKNQAAQAKHSIKRLFDVFKRLSKEENTRDFRLNQADYLALLNYRYQVNQKPEKLFTALQKNVDNAQAALSKALESFMYEIQEDEITVIEDVDGVPETSEAVPAKASKKSPKNKKEKNQEQSLRNAQDFYAVLKRMPNIELDQDPLEMLQQDIEQAADFFSRKNILPMPSLAFNTHAMPPYYAYIYSYLLIPSYGNQAGQQADFFLRLPEGNQLAKQEQLNSDFNIPTRKLMVTEELFPGRYYQMLLNEKTSNWRHFYPAQSSVNGWSRYAQELAKEQGYLVTDDELLFFSWEQYLNALQALVDARLNTQQLTYSEAMDLLTGEHGLEQAQAELLIKQIVYNPGQAISYQTGLEMYQNLRQKYRKKLGKKFNEADFHAKVLKSGNITQQYLDKEIAALYKKEKKK